MLRAAALAACGLAVWLVAAGELPSHVRLPLSSVVGGATVTQGFGCTAVVLEPIAPFCPGRPFHTGVDLAAKLGTPVHSATSGIVELGYDSAGAGNYVVVDVDAHVRIFYCHLSAFRVRPGEAVEPGQVIGLVGQTGLATGPHVHLEVQVDRTAVDPSLWLRS